VYILKNSLYSGLISKKCTRAVTFFFLVENLCQLDLRGNMGGLLTAGIGLANLILPPGCLIATLEGSSGEVVTHYARNKRSIIPLDRPLIVVTDGLTASSSELAAAALSDNGRALLVGSTSFGKASIQAIVRLSDDSGLQLTIGKFRTLRDSIVSGRGIVPAITLSWLGPDEASVSQIEDAVKRL
jgi:carboxyl-terminal processing protease